MSEFKGKATLTIVTVALTVTVGCARFSSSARTAPNYSDGASSPQVRSDSQVALVAHSESTPRPTTSHGLEENRFKRLASASLLQAVPAEVGEAQQRVESAMAKGETSAPFAAVADQQNSNSLNEQMTVESLLALAFANNPTLKQAQAVANKANGVRAQVGYKPNTNIGYFGQEIGNDGAGGQHGAFLSQTLVRGEKLQWNRTVLGHEVNALRWQVDVQKQRVITDIQIRFYRALAAQRKLRQAREFRNDASKAVEIARQRLEATEGTRPDLLQSEILVDQIDLEIRAAELELRGAWQEVAALAGVPEMQPANLDGDLDSDSGSLDQESLFQRIVLESPILRAATSRVHRASANLQRQKQQPVSNVQTQLGIGYDDSTGDDYANVQLSLPLRNHHRNQGNIRAAYAEYCEATYEVERIRLLIRQQLANAMRRYDTARARSERLRDSILPKADQSLRLIQQAHAAGDAEFLRVLTARQSFFQFNQQYVDQLGLLAQIRAEIDGLLLTGGLQRVDSYDADDGLRGQALNNR